MSGQGRSLPRQKRSESKKPEIGSTYSRKLEQRKEEKKLTIDDVLDLMEAGGQHRLPVSPGGALALELGQERNLFLLCLLLRLLEQLLLLRQLHG